MTFRPDDDRPQLGLVASAGQGCLAIGRQILLLDVEPEASHGSQGGPGCAGEFKFEREVAAAEERNRKFDDAWQPASPGCHVDGISKRHHAGRQTA